MTLDLVIIIISIIIIIKCEHSRVNRVQKLVDGEAKKFCRRPWPRPWPRPWRRPWPRPYNKVSQRRVGLSVELDCSHCVDILHRLKMFCQSCCSLLHNTMVAHQHKQLLSDFRNLFQSLLRFTFQSVTGHVKVRTTIILP